MSVFEIETPVDKHDLVRLEDKYGREGEPYEDDSFEVPKKEDCLWVDGSTKTYNFANCKIEVESISDVNGFDDKHKEQRVQDKKLGNPAFKKVAIQWCHLVRGDTAQDAMPRILRHW